MQKIEISNVMQQIKKIIIAIGLIPLVACVSTETTKSNVIDLGNKVKSIDEIIGYTTPIKAEAKSLTVNVKDKRASLSNQKLVKFRDIGDDMIQVTYEGRTYILEKSNNYRKRIETGDEISFIRGSKLDYFTAFKYVDIGAVIYGKPDKSTLEVTNFDFGGKTQNMPTNQINATYKGNFLISAYPKNFNDVNELIHMHGDTTISANLNEGTLSGRFDNIKNTRTNDTIAGQINITNGKVNKNVLTSKINGDQTLNQSLNKTVYGDLNGSFYGPNAEEVGGKLTIDSEELAGTGAFAAAKQ